MKVSGLWQLYLSAKTLERYSPKTLKQYSLYSGLFIRDTGDPDISALDLAALKTYLADQTHLKASSLNTRIRFLRSLFNWAHREGVMKDNIAWKLKESRTSKRVPKALSEEIMEKMRMGCRFDIEHALVELFFASGCRLEELRQMNRADLNWHTQSFMVIGKGDKEREAMFSTRARLYVQRYLDSRTDDHEALFVTMRRPIRRVSSATIQYTFKRIAKRAGVKLELISPHKFRHTFAVRLMDNGAPLEVIQTLLGHEKAETTRLYADLSGEARRRLYKKHFHG